MAVSDYLLEIKGPDLKGESQDDQFKESIHIDSWSWTGTNSSMHHVGAGGGAGKVMHGDMQCQKYLDKASIILFDKLNCGDHFKKPFFIAARRPATTARRSSFSRSR